MNPMKFWKRFVLWSVLILAVVAPGAVLAAEEDEELTSVPAVPSFWDSLVPDREDQVGDITVEYEKYPLNHYHLDLYIQDRSLWDFITSPIDTTKEQGIQMAIAVLHLLINSFWQLSVELSRVVIWIMEESLRLDIVGELISYVGEGVRTLAGFDENLHKRGFYGLMFPLVTVFFAGYTGYRAMQENDDMTLINGIITFLIIVLGSFAFFYYIEEIATELNKFGTEMGKGLMALTTNTFQPMKNLSAEEATVQAGNNLWNMTVMTPYKLLEFGTDKVDQKRVDAILSTHPEKRGELLIKEKKTYKNEMILPSNVLTRGIGVFLFFVMNLFVWVIPLFIAIFKLVYQGWFLIVLLMSPIALAWAIVPAWREILYKWASELLGAVLMQVALGMLLAIYLAVGGALYKFGQEKGYLLMVLLQIILSITIFLQRKMIFSFVIAPATFLHWSATSKHRHPMWAPISPHRLEGLFEDAFSGDLLRQAARSLKKKWKDRASEGTKSIHEEPKQDSAPNQEDIPELKEINKTPEEEVIFRPYDDPQLTTPDPELLEKKDLESDARMLESEEKPQLLDGSEEKPALLDGVDQKPEVVDADVTEVKMLEERASDTRQIESESDTPLLLAEKEAEPEANGKTKDEGPILLIEPQKKEGQDRDDR